MFSTRGNFALKALDLIASSYLFATSALLAWDIYHELVPGSNVVALLSTLFVAHWFSNSSTAYQKAWQDDPRVARYIYYGALLFIILFNAISPTENWLQNVWRIAACAGTALIFTFLPLPTRKEA